MGRNTSKIQPLLENDTAAMSRNVNRLVLFMFGNTDSNQTRQTKVRAGQYDTIERVFVGSNPPWIHTVTGDPAPRQEKWSNSECVGSELDSVSKRPPVHRRITTL